MPPVPVPNDGFLVGTIQDLRYRMAALETQQQSIISNLQGQPVVAFGLSPGSNPAQYGIQLLAQAFGSEVAFFGEDATGATALKFRNASGGVQVQVDVNGLHFYDGSGHEVVRIDATGLHVYNSAGTQEVAAGALSDGTYGLEVLDPGGSGNLLKLFSPVLAQVNANQSLSSTSFVDLATPGPTATFTVGPSGKAFVLATANVNPNANTGGQSGYLGLSVDGAAAYEIAIVSSSVTENLATPAAAIQQLSLSPGTHTAKLQYATSSGTTVAFFYRTLIVFTY